MTIPTAAPDRPRACDPDALTVLYDGACPLCRREIAHLQGLAGRQPRDAGLRFVDLTGPAAADACRPEERPALLVRLHVQRGDGSRIDGAAAFVAVWRRLPGWRWLARIARLPGAPAAMEVAYRLFLRARPALQALARRLEAAGGGATARPQSPPMSRWLERELRSDHAGETGAVAIYAGLAAVAAWRGDAALADFARRHGATEAEHLRLIEGWLPAARRSRLLVPWRVAGWLTGALPALAGPRAVHATIAAVETFVDAHYQQQIDRLQREGGRDELLALLRRCQADERHHREEAEAATAAAGPRAPLLLRAWCAAVGGGSAAAVLLARRV